MFRFLIILLLLFSSGCSQKVYYKYYKTPRTWTMSAPSKSEFMNRENHQFWNERYENFGKKNPKNYPEKLSP